MKFNLKTLRELINDCQPESMLEAYCDDLIKELRDTLTILEGQNMSQSQGYAKGVNFGMRCIIKGILGVEA